MRSSVVVVLIALAGCGGADTPVKGSGVLIASKKVASFADEVRRLGCCTVRLE